MSLLLKKNHYLLSFFGVLLLCLWIVPAAAQTNYADVKVDDLSDAQIRTLMQRAEAIGFNDAQLEQMALAQGMKPAEIEKLRARVTKLRGQDPGAATDNTMSLSDYKDNSRARRYTDSLNSDDPTYRRQYDRQYDRMQLLQQDKIDELFDGMKTKVFGAGLFKNKNISFEPDLKMPTPKNYVIGPEDQLLIDITGDNEKEYKLKVSPDGTIRMEYVGLIAVGGLSIESATAKIRNAMQATYPAIRSGRTQIAVNLGNIRSIKVILTGEIVKPGTYTLPSLATVFNALYASGGPNDNGSFRNIQVIRNGVKVSTIDTYDFLMNGVQRGNIRLQDQDVIYVPVYNTRVEVSGELKRIAFFEMQPGESLSDVLRFAGGFSADAYRGRIKALQNTDKERRVSDVPASEFAQYKPQNGDKYVVEPILDRFENRVEIWGAVFRSGTFELEKGLTLKQLIQKAEGLKEDAFMTRAYINRLNADNTMGLVSFDLGKLMAGTVPDILLQREDKVMISSIFDMREEYKVQIQGEVRNPGTFDYAKAMHLEDLIQMAGGFKEGATPTRIEISRRVKSSETNSVSAKTAEIFVVNVDAALRLREKQFVLEPFDIVAVRNAEGYMIQRQVKLEGEVIFPGPYTINRKDERISDIIKRAGGLTVGAYPEGGSLKRPGAEKANPQAKNAINNADEEERNLLNLERIRQQNGRDIQPKDSVNLALEQKLVQSDLIGIDLVDIMAHPGSNSDLILEDGDIIRIPKMLQVVKVTGEVLNPNGIVFKKSRGLKSYINGAGGFTPNALRRNVYVKYANGTAEAARKFLIFNTFPKVKPGAEIMVPKRGAREPMTTQAWISISTALASMAAIIITLFR